MSERNYEKIEVPVWEYYSISELETCSLFFFYLRNIDPVHIMATMAAAIAASLPAVQAAPTPVAPTQQALPPSWNKCVDAEAEIPITTVQIDGLVCLDGSRGRTGPLNDDSL